MMKKFVVLLVSVGVIIFGCNNFSAKTPPHITKGMNSKIDSIVLNKKIEEATVFSKAKKFSPNLFILIDIYAHSGLQRLVVVKDKKIIKSACVSQGCGKNEWGKDFGKENPSISNVTDSHCSSIGKYKIGARGKSQWGIGVNYLLHGLESSNSNALKRQIVLHSWEAITESSVFPNGTPEGWGCPAVANSTMVFLDSILQQSKEPVLMWVY